MVDDDDDKRKTYIHNASTVANVKPLNKQIQPAQPTGYQLSVKTPPTKSVIPFA